MRDAKDTRPGSDPAAFEIVKNSLYKIAEEMRVVLAKTAYSPLLKSAGDFELFREICAERGLAEAPNTIVQADVCRPELLCEMEAIAVVPTES